MNVDPKETLKTLVASDATKVRERFGEKPITFLQTFDNQIKFPKKIREIYARIWRREKSRFIIKAPRGGGKSRLLGALGFCLWYFKHKDIVDMGGSLEQAKVVYNYFQSHCYMDPVILNSLPDEPQIQKSKSDHNAVFKCVAASLKQIRGPHPDILFADEACFPAGQRILTPEGVKNIEDIERGDAVYGSAGQEQSVVTSMQRKYEGELVRIKPAGNTYGYTTTADHPVLVVRRTFQNSRYWKDRLPEPEWIRADQVCKGDAVVHPIGKNKKAQDYDWEWFLGLYVAEGSTNNYGKVYISLHSEETEYINRVERIMWQRLGKRVSVYKQKNKKAVNVQVSGKDLARYLSEQCGTGAQNKRLPIVTEATVQGYIDGDGMERKAEKIGDRETIRIRVHTYSEHIVHQLQRFYTNEKQRCMVFKRPNGKWQLEVNDSDYKSTGWHDDKFFYFTVNAVEKETWSGTVYNFQTPDNTYCIPGGLVHNCETKDEYVLAALPMVDTSPEPLIVITSTFHKVFGVFQEIWDRADELGYQRFDWDVFDVVKPFSETIWDDEQLNREIPDFDKLKTKAKGRTGDPDGWIPIENVIQAWRERLNDDHFDVEYMGDRPNVAGLVNDPADVDACTFEPKENMGYNYKEGAEVVLGIDWGFSSMTSIVELMRHAEEVVQLDNKNYTQAPLKTIVEDTVEMIRKRGAKFLYADSSGKFENDALRNALRKENINCKVIEVNFSKEKGEHPEHGMLGNYRAYFQRRKIRIPNTHRTAIWQHKRYRYKEGSDKPVKQDDHIPDATMCGLLHWKLGKGHTDFRDHGHSSDVRPITGGLLNKRF